MTTATAVALGILQGITEFLPVSSSGHLALARALLGYDLEPGMTFEIAVHFGSFCSIVVYFRKRLAGLFHGLASAIVRCGSSFAAYRADPSVRFTAIVLVSMLPAVAVGVTTKRYVEHAFVNPMLTASLLLVTGTALFSTRFANGRRAVRGGRARPGDSAPQVSTPGCNEEGVAPGRPVTLRSGAWIGVAQAVAILPGISRSGATISTGLWLGVRRDELAEFSFLMVLPVLAGATLLESLELVLAGRPVVTTSLAAGFAASFVTGYLALASLIALLKRSKLHYFGYYCWALGLIGLFYFLTTRV